MRQTTKKLDRAVQQKSWDLIKVDYELVWANTTLALCSEEKPSSYSHRCALSYKTDQGLLQTVWSTSLLVHLCCHDN